MWEIGVAVHCLPSSLLETALIHQAFVMPAASDQVVDRPPCTQAADFTFYWLQGCGTHGVGSETGITFICSLSVCLVYQKHLERENKQHCHLKCTQSCSPSLSSCRSKLTLHDDQLALVSVMKCAAARIDQFKEGANGMINKRLTGHITHLENQSSNQITHLHNAINNYYTISFIKRKKS